jgi:hypothetical protein
VSLDALVIRVGLVQCLIVVCVCAVRREFEEEACAVAPEHQERFRQVLETVFAPGAGREVFRGYVDDPRNCGELCLVCWLVRPPLADEHLLSTDRQCMDGDCGCALPSRT